MKTAFVPIALILPLLVTVATAALADVFGTGANQFTIDFVEIGNPGNAPDKSGNPNPGGAVGYSYRIATYEASRDIVLKASSEGGLKITLGDMSSIGGNSPSRPATGVTWNEAARFINWLNTSQGYSPAYKFTVAPGESGYRPNSNIELWKPDDPGYNAANPFRNSQAHYFLPSSHEWYKAAYYDPAYQGGTGGYWDFPVGTDQWPVPVASGTAPGTVVYKQNRPTDVTQAGGLSPYGVMGLAGNVFEWEETEIDLINNNASSLRAASGDDWAGDPYPYFLSASDHRYGVSPTSEEVWIGFRVASVAVPEPTSWMVLMGSGIGLLSYFRRRGH